MRAGLCAVLVLVSAVAHAAPSVEARAEAQRHLAAGSALFQAGNIDGAMVELEAAHRIDPSAKTCYALGQGHRLKGRYELAIDYFRCAESKAPSVAFAEAARFQVGRCKADQAAAEAGRVAAPDAPAPTALPAEPETPPPVLVHRAWHRDAAGGTLVGVGAAALVAGAGVLGHAGALRAGSTRDLDGYFAAQASYGAERVAGAIVLSLGGALLVGGAIRWGLVARRR